MSRVCIVTGKRTVTGNNVSHANNKTKRRFLPNLQKATFLSEILGRTFSLRLSTRGIRTIEHKGGLDQFLVKSRAAKLDSSLLKIRRQVQKAAETQK